MTRLDTLTLLNWIPLMRMVGSNSSKSMHFTRAIVEPHCDRTIPSLTFRVMLISTEELTVLT